MSAGAIAIAGLDGYRVRLSPAQLQGLASRLGGRMLRPTDQAWEDAVRIWNAMVAKKPALVLQPASPHEAAAAVAFASDHRLRISVKGGGHHIAGTSIAEGGLMLDMSRMREVKVDAAARVASVEPGCRLRDVDRATQEHGLATVLGFISDTGVAGLTLGGGLGYLTRRFGWTVDNLEEVEVVTADGQIRIANRNENADLFWAMRGAGANLGVATRFTYRLHQIGPTVFGGLIAWPFGRAREILRAYRSITTEAPRELAVWLNLLHAPPAPFIPMEWHGRKICAMAVCYSGDMARVDEVIAPIRKLGNPIADLLREQPYVQVQSYLDATEPAGLHHYWKTEYLAELSEDLLSTVREAFAAAAPPEAEIGILHIGGALNERAEDDGAVGNRDARFAIGVKAMWDPGRADTGAVVRWVRDGWERVRPFSTGRSYVNFQTADEGEERVRATYGANLDRLIQVKARFDPGNLFRSNRNVDPRAAARERLRGPTPS